MSLKCVKLISGEEVIGEVTEHPDGTKITISVPANIFLQPNGKGQVTIALMPMFPYAEKKEFVYPASSVMCSFAPSRELFNEYNRIFGSGLVIPTIDIDPKSILMG